MSLIGLWKVIRILVVNTKCGHSVNEVAVEDVLPECTPGDLLGQ